jgi:hypothetical protein
LIGVGVWNDSEYLRGDKCQDKYGSYYEADETAGALIYSIRFDVWFGVVHWINLTIVSIKTAYGVCMIIIIAIRGLAVYGTTVKVL